MKLKRKNRSVLFRGMVLGLAMAFTVLCFPVNQIAASAETMDNFTDYTFMTVGTKKEKVETVVNKGATYVVPKAYIGGDRDRAIGSVISDKDLATDVKLLSSKVTVKYSSEIVGEVVDGTASATGSVTVTDAGNAQFTASKVGAYTVTYSYTYTVKETVGGVSKDVEYTNSYDMTVTSEITDADINFDDNEKVFLPSILDLKQAEKSDGSFKDMYIPMPEILDDNGDEVDTSASNTDFEFITQRTKIGDTKQQVLIEVSASTNSTKVEVKGNATDGFYVAGSTFADAQYGAGKYTVTYSYYENGQFIASTTKTTQVYAKDDAYYKDYALRLQLNSDFVDNGETGVEKTLPTAKGVTATSTTPKSEAVDIYYTVTVYYKTSTSDYALLDADKYNAKDEAGNVIEEERIVNEDGTLVDPTRFKPLEDGYYSFVYEGYDYYFDHNVENPKTASVNKNHYFKTDLGLYEYKNITDKKNPTPVVYQATEDGSLDNVDASSKMATRANAESVVIYAIGIDDNVSKAGDEGVVLTRKIMTDETNLKISLSSTDERDLSDFNLIFNYAGRFDASATEKKYGRDGLKTYNYLIRTQMEKDNVADTEEATLAWLIKNKYLIVVDNANYERLYENFKNEANVFDATVTDKATALEWFKSDAAFAKGFAYINCDQTFGSSAAITGGMGVGQYYIHYIAKDAAGNETDIYKRLYVRDYEDRESPDITFSTSLKDSYLPDTKITFSAPTASDKIDENMTVSVMYRYLDEDGKVMTVSDKKGNVISDKDLATLWTALGTDPDGEGVRDDNNTLLTTKYALYHETATNDGYVDITDAKASSFTIDLSEVEGASKLQIVVYTYDDAGNPMLHAQTIDIKNIKDELPPQLMSVSSIEDSFTNKYAQGAVIALPKVVVADDAVAYMTSDVKVDYIEDGEKYSRSVRETTVDRVDGGAAGKYIVNAGEFVAAKDGKYQASIAVKDANNKTIVVFANYTVSARATVQKPVISSTLTSQEIELDDKETIEIPAPTVNFELGDSITADEFKKNPSATETFVIRGLNADGKATNWTTNNQDATNGIFKPSKKGQFEIKYSVKLEAYNHNKFTYVEMGVPSYNETTDEVEYTDGGYYTNNTLGSSYQITFGENGEHRIKDVDNNVYFAVRQDEKKNITFYTAREGYTSYTEVEKKDLQGTLKNVDFEQWFEDLQTYNLESEIFTITVNDTKGPKLINYDYSDQEFMSVEDFKNNGIKIYGIQTAADVSGIDSSRSEIRISWKRANGTAAGDTGSTTYQKAEALKDNTFRSAASNLNGKYTITYEVYDNNGNRSTATYTISVGDNEAPTIKLPEKFVKTSYTLKDNLVIDTKDITISDNNPLPDDTKPVIKLVNTSKNNEEVAYKEDKYTENGKEYSKYTFDSFEEYGEGTYKLIIEVEDAVGHVTTNDDCTFTVASKTKNSAETYKVVGTILIVVAVLVLAGVIVYFIVSKVKLDKELKK